MEIPSPSSARSGAPFADRGRVTADHLAAIRAIWTQDTPAYRGRFATFDKVQARPRPVQTPTPPIVIGGHTPPAFRRAVEQGQALAARLRARSSGHRQVHRGAREAARRHPRPAELGALEISVTPRGRLDRAAAEAYASASFCTKPPRPAAAAQRLSGRGLEQFVASVGWDRIGKV